MTIQLNLIGLVVADLPESLAFYRRLGLAVPAAADAEPHVEVTLPGGLRLAWDPVDVVKSFDAEWTPPTGGHRINLAFRCESPAAVDAKYDELVEAGYNSHLKPWDAVWGQRYAVVDDPDGNAVDLFAPIAG